MWIAFTQFIDSLLVADHAAHQCHKEITALQLGVFKLCELVVRFFLRSFTHAARIQDHEVCLIHAGLFPAQFVQDGLDALRIGLVHLTANSPDVVFASCDIRRGHRFASPSKNGLYC